MNSKKIVLWLGLIFIILALISSLVLLDLISQRRAILQPKLEKLAEETTEEAVSGSSVYTGVSVRLHGSATSTVGVHNANPKLKLVSAMTYWSALQPTKGGALSPTVMSIMNANVSHARENSYKIIWRIMAGRNAPAWLFDNGVQKISLLGTDELANDYCDYFDLAVLWDPKLKEHYTDLMTKVAAWLEQPDGAGGKKGDHIYFIPVAMPTTQGSEMVLGYGQMSADKLCPDDTEGKDKNLRQHNISEWNSVSTVEERRTKSEQAWKEAIDIHMQKLPINIKSSIAYGHIFEDNQAGALRIADEKVKQYPGRLWSMYTNLRSSASGGPWRDWCGRCHIIMLKAIESYQSKGKTPLVGFQTAGFAKIGDLQIAADDALTTYGIKFLETNPQALSESEVRGYLLLNSNNFQDRLGDSDLPITPTVQPPTSTPTSSPTPTLTPTPSPSPTPTVLPTATPAPTQQPQSLIKIYASGTALQGVYPTMQLVIDNHIVKTWTNVSPTSQGYPKLYSYMSPTKVVSGTTIKVLFVNDDHLKGVGDINLRVNKIIVDGKTYETESSTVYSIGTWTPSEGCTNGYKKSEWLYCNGQFRYQIK